MAAAFRHRLCIAELTRNEAEIQDMRAGKHIHWDEPGIEQSRQAMLDYVARMGPAYACPYMGCECRFMTRRLVVSSLGLALFEAGFRTESDVTRSFTPRRLC